jgi:two-component system sensor histidine kinase SenX3
VPRRVNRTSHIVLDSAPDRDSGTGHDALRDDFVANLGHELKSPVGALMLLAEAMHAEDDLYVVRRLADRVLEEAQRMGALVEDLLEFGQKQSAPWEHVPVLDIVADALWRIAPAAHARDIFLAIDESPAGAWAFGSRRQLSSALGNLLENGVKYSAEHGRVELRIALSGGWIDFSVCDQGIGIAPSDIDHIFERFYRGTPSVAHEGSGLGLAIVQQVAVDHGGEVSVRSTEGAGSEFTLRLPLAMESPVRPIRLARWAR